jgi:ATP-binding cassette subfamily F protein 3
VTDFDGDIDDYQQWLNDDKKQSIKANKIVSDPQVDKKQQRKEQAELRKKASPLRKKADKFEKLVQKSQDELTEVEAKLADSDIYQAEHKAKLTELLKRQAKLTQDLEANEIQWLDLEEQIEEIMSQAL